MPADLKDGRPWDGHHPRITGAVAAPCPLRYGNVSVLTPQSRKGYFLLLVDIGDGAFVEWMLSRN